MKTTVAILFEDPDINEVFAELLLARGLHPIILSSTTDADGLTKIITEPQYFHHLPPAPREHCLVVGNKNALLNCNAICLSRPLTEEKIESAMSEFLSNS